KVMDDKQSQTYTYKNCIIATGSAPIEIPSFPFSKRVIDSTGALDLEEIPGKLVVIGGGYIGTELGSAYANLGSEVTNVEGEKETDKGVKVTYEANGKEETIEADYVLVTVGRKPNTQEIGLEQVGVEVDDKGLIKIDKQCRTNVKNFYAIGDIVDGLPLAH